MGEQEQGLQLPEHSQAHQNVHEGVIPGEDREEVKLVELAKESALALAASLEKKELK